MGEDNRAHRAKGLRCATCMWYVSKLKSDGTPGEVGRCRKKAPTMDGWPVRFQGDWCGQHKLDENKLEV